MVVVVSYEVDSGFHRWSIDIKTRGKWKGEGCNSVHRAVEVRRQETYSSCTPVATQTMIILPFSRGLVDLQLLKNFMGEFYYVLNRTYL